MNSLHKQITIIFSLSLSLVCSWWRLWEDLEWTLRGWGVTGRVCQCHATSCSRALVIQAPWWSHQVVPGCLPGVLLPRRTQESSGEGEEEERTSSAEEWEWQVAVQLFRLSYQHEWQYQWQQHLIIIHVNIRGLSSALLWHDAPWWQPVQHNVSSSFTLLLFEQIASSFSPCS